MEIDADEIAATYSMLLVTSLTALLAFTVHPGVIGGPTARSMAVRMEETPKNSPEVMAAKKAEYEANKVSAVFSSADRVYCAAGDSMSHCNFVDALVHAARERTVPLHLCVYRRPGQHARRPRLVLQVIRSRCAHLQPRQRGAAYLVGGARAAWWAARASVEIRALSTVCALSDSST